MIILTKSNIIRRPKRRSTHVRPRRIVPKNEKWRECISHIVKKIKSFYRIFRNLIGIAIELLILPFSVLCTANKQMLLRYSYIHYGSLYCATLGTQVMNAGMALCLKLSFFTRCIFSDIIRFNNLIFQVIVVLVIKIIIY